MSTQESLEELLTTSQMANAVTAHQQELRFTVVKVHSGIDAVINTVQVDYCKDTEEDKTQVMLLNPMNEDGQNKDEDTIFGNNSETTNVVLSQENVVGMNHYSAQNKINTNSNCMKQNIVTDITKSSPCSPTFMEEDGNKAQKRQRSYSDSGEQLTAQDRACLEEIERGSQLIPEEKELFDYLSKNNKLDLNLASQKKAIKKRVVIMKNDNVGSLVTAPTFNNQFISIGSSGSNIKNTNPKNSIDINNMDTLESALIQSSIPVAVSNKKGLMMQSKVNTLNNVKTSSSKLVSATKTNTQQQSVLSSNNKNLNMFSSNSNKNLSVFNSNKNSRHTVQHTVTSIPASPTVVASSSSVVYNNTKVSSQSVLPNVVSTGHGQNIAVNVAQPVAQPVPQTIQKVVVHMEGKERVFDVPQLGGQLLTIQPMTMLPSNAVEGGMGTLVIPPEYGYAIAEDNCMLLPVGDSPSPSGEPVLRNDSKPRRMIQQLQLNPDGTVVDITEKPYVCKDCGMAYAKPSKLKLHTMSKHTGDRPYKCSYRGCDWAFTAKYKLQRHEECHQNRQKGLKEYKCPIESCGKSCTTVYNLNAHMRLHSRPKSEKCEVCSEQFGTLKQLDRHMKETHGEKFKNVKCPYEGCTKMFYSRVSMGSHMMSHQRGNHFPCTFDDCDRVFTQRCKLMAHMRVHTKEKPFKCTVEDCKWEFASSSHLRRHLKTHTNERNYPCSLCDKKFLRPEHLKGHMITHTGEKPFCCDIPGCGAKFSAKSTMYIHMKKHKRMDNNVCVCPIEGCQKMFQGKSFLRKHIDQHYGKEARESGTEQIKGVQVVRETESLTTDSSGLQFLNLNLPANQINGINQIIISPEIAQSLLAASAGSMIEAGIAPSEADCKPITIPCTAAELAEDSDNSNSPENSGSARTDYHSNHLLSIRAKKRRQILKQKAAQAGFDLISVQDIADTSKMNTRFEDDQDGVSGPVINPNEVMTSRAITIRDPETGAIYLQTQLLQDDPPNLEFEDSVLDCGSNIVDFSGLIHDANLAETLTTSSIVEFPGSISSSDVEN